MVGRPIFVATHPRSCSTAFERVFLTRSEDLACAHEPFGDAFYYGPERLSKRFADDEKMRVDSGFSNVVYKDILDKLLSEEKRLFIKDMAYYLMPVDGKPAAIAPSLADRADPDADRPGRNPTVLPRATLGHFHFTFLIRHPRRSIPSYYRCTVPPLVDATRFQEFLPSEAGYAELRRLFDYLRAEGLVGAPARGIGTPNGTPAITVLDADDLLDRPVEAIQAFCRAVDLDYRPEMLQWADPANQKHASDAFEKWTGFHNDALASTGLLPRATHHKTPAVEAEDKDWTAKYGEAGQKTIRACVDANVADYEYLKQFALKF